MQISNNASKGAPVGAAMGVLLAALVLAGCGGSSKAASGAGTSVGATRQSTATSAAAAGSSPSSTPSSISGNSNSSFCVEAAGEQAQEAKNSDEIATDSPADLRKFFEQEQAELKVFVSKAPSQIKGSVQTIVAADNALVNALNGVNYDFTKLDPNFTQTFDTPTFEAAVTSVDNYLEQVCGLHPSDDSTS